jgi:tripartite-type tricarboxylate transporter receptor subunit TctC
VINMVVSRFRFVALLLASFVFAATAFAQQAEKFPSRAVTIVVGFAPGGGGDVSMRWVADYLRERWKVPVIVENKPGAGATLAAAQVARAKPDGYTVILATSSPFTVAPYFQKVGYDPAKDFTYLFQFLVSAQPLFVRSDSQFKTVQELIAWGKANPKKLFWSTAATNGVTHVTTQAAFKAAGIDATYVPYKGGADALRALLAGDIQAIVAAEFPAYAAAGKVRLLAESGPDKIPAYPQVPTYRELGFPVSVPIFYGIAGPAGMPAAAVREWEAAATDMVRTPGFEELVTKLQGTPSFKGHDEFQAIITDVYARMLKLLPELGMKKD